MNALQTILILAFAFLAVFGEALLPGVRRLLGAQVDLLPVPLLAVLGGLCFDALSANPLGITLLPLFTVGLAIFSKRELILHTLPFAQIVLGAVASAAVPALTVLLLLTGGQQPLLGWGSLWQWLVMTLGGAAAAPFIFALFAGCHHALGHPPRTETSFRADREIHRGSS